MPLADDLLGVSINTARQYQDPFKLWSGNNTPKDLKSLFKWTEYLYYNSAQIYAGVKKFAEYPITEIRYLTTSPKIRDRYKELLEEVIGIKSCLIRSSLDLHVYGNSFSSVHIPFKRFLVCDSCGHKSDIRSVDYTLKLDKLAFKGHCSSCNSTRKMTVEDQRILDVEKVNLIRWDPKCITISHNPVTGDSQYYLDVPEDLVSSIKKADEHLIASTPYSILQAVSEGSTFKFASGELFHMKSDSPAGVEGGWGYPSLMAAMHLFYHASVMRKANEAIALERIVPMRILHPAATSGNGDPIMSMSISSWIDDMKTSVKEWRKDPNHMVFAPVAVGVSQIGGDARALMVDSEIQRAEDNIIASMGLPKEFIYGGLSFTGSGVTLRMLENQLESSLFQINNLLQWTTDKLSKYLSWDSCKVALGDFKMVDDVQQKGIFLNLWQSGVVSKTTLAEANGIDLAEERERMKQEQLEDAQLQREIQMSIQEMQNTLADQARAEVQMGNPGQQAQGSQYDQQAVIAQAENIALQMLQMDPNMRRSQLSSLQSEDYVMYSVVIQRLEQLQLDQKNQAAQANLQQMGVN
jgi:hypothetical protein